MTEPQTLLAARLIRNFNDADLESEVREPLYETMCARLATGTVARKLGASIDTVAPGKRSCPYHFHHAREEMFKYQAMVSAEGARVFGAVQRTGQSVDYWDGEP